MLRWFAGKQIRNVAAVGGNIVTGKILYTNITLILYNDHIDQLYLEVAIIFIFPWNVGSPISDLNPIFMSAGCTLELVSKANGVS